MNDRSECPNCGSSDNLITWEDGHKYCFSPNCSYNKSGHPKGQRKTRKKEEKPIEPVILTPVRLPKRRLLEVTCAKFGVGVFEKQIHFPYYKDGKLMGYKVRNHALPKKHKGHFYVKGSINNVLFGNQCVHTNKVIAITSGEYDAMSVTQMAGVAAVSLGGDSMAEKTILANMEWLETFEKIILCIDNDSAGNKATDIIRSILRPYQTFSMVFPTGHKDASDMLQSSQTELFTRSLWSAKPTPIQSLFTKDELEISLSTQDEVPKGTPTGIVRLDMAMGGLRPHELTTVVAKSFQGKSTFSRIVFSNLLREKHKCLVVALEEQPLKYSRRLLHTYIGRPTHEISENEKSFLIGQMLESVEISRLNGKITTQDLSDCIEYSVRRDKIKYVLVDNLSAAVNRSKLFEESSAFVETLFGLCGKFPIHVFLVCHTHRKGDSDLESGYGTSAIEHHSDNMIIVEREAESDYGVNIRLVKNRELGRETEFTTQFDPRTGRYEEGKRSASKQTREGALRQLSISESLIQV